MKVYLGDDPECEWLLRVPVFSRAGPYVVLRMSLGILADIGGYHPTLHNIRSTCSNPLTHPGEGEPKDIYGG